MKKVILFVTSFMLFSACKKNYEDLLNGDVGQVSENRVETVNVELSRSSIPIYAIGKVSTDKEVGLSFKIGGIISSIRADEGQYVQKGSLLATMRTNEIDASVLKANRSLEKAQRDLDRVKKMYADSAATLENVQDLTTLVEVSKADLDIALFNQEFAKVVSPVSGRVLRRLAEPNELVNPGQPILLVSTRGSQSQVMTVALSDRDVARIKTGDRAEMEFDAYPGEMITGSITQIAELSDPVTGTFEIDLAISAGGKRLRNGYVARVSIYPDNDQEYWKVPLDAIVEGEGRILRVFALTEGLVAKEMEIVPMHISTEFVAVKTTASNQALSTVITTGAEYLKDGDEVVIVP